LRCNFQQQAQISSWLLITGVSVYLLYDKLTFLSEKILVILSVATPVERIAGWSVASYLLDGIAIPGVNFHLYHPTQYI
jgi:hypothetical protein